MKLGTIFEKIGQLDSAKYYAEMAYSRVMEKPLDGQMPYFYCTICNLLGTIQDKLNNPIEAKRFFQLALNKGIEVNYLKIKNNDFR